MVAEQRREGGGESTRASALGLTSEVLMAVSALPFSLCHVAPTGGPDKSDFQLVAAHSTFSAFCYSLAEEVVVF